MTNISGCTKRQALLSEIIDMELETLRLFKEGKKKALRNGRMIASITFDQSMATNQRNIDFFVNKL